MALNVLCCIYHCVREISEERKQRGRHVLCEFWEKCCLFYVWCAFRDGRVYSFNITFVCFTRGQRKSCNEFIISNALAVAMLNFPTAKRKYLRFKLVAFCEYGISSVSFSEKRGISASTQIARTTWSFSLCLWESAFQNYIPLRCFIVFKVVSVFLRTVLGNVALYSWLC